MIKKFVVMATYYEYNDEGYIASGGGEPEIICDTYDIAEDLLWTLTLNTLCAQPISEMIHDYHDEDLANWFKKWASEIKFKDTDELIDAVIPDDVSILAVKDFCRKFHYHPYYVVEVKCL